MKEENSLSKIVRNVTLVISIPVVAFGFYLILHGHLTPGGGFAGGAVIATSIALFVVAYGDKFKSSIEKFSISESIGLIAFITLAVLGISVTFFHNFLANSNLLFGMPITHGPNPGYLGTAGVIPLMNLAVGLEVFSALSLIIIILYFVGDKND